MPVDAICRTAAFPDIIERIGADAFIPAGRVDGAVQVGGINVLPEVIAALRERPGVAEAAVRLMRSDEGLRLKAFIADGSIEQEALRAALVGSVAQTTVAESGRLPFRRAVAAQCAGQARRMVIDRTQP